MTNFITAILNVHTCGENDSCCKVINETTVQINKEGSREIILDNVLKDESSISVWNTVGECALQTASEGKQALIFVTGESESGKSHIIRGTSGNLEDCLISRLLNEITKVSETSLCILHAHNDNIQDLVTEIDNLRIKLEENNTAFVNGATIVKVSSVEEGKTHIKKCLLKRDKIFKLTKVMEENSFIIFFIGFNGGRITLIESCGSEGCLDAPASLKPETERDIENKNQLFSKISGLWIESATNADPKAISFRDTKIGQIIQPGLSAAIEQNGYAAQIVCVKNTKKSLRETEFMISYCEACLKKENLKTVSEYKEIIASLEETIEEEKKSFLVLQEAAKQAENSVIKRKENIFNRIIELEKESSKIKNELQEAKIEHEKKIKNLKDFYNHKLIELKQKNEVELERMRNLAKNAPVQAANDIKKVNENVQSEHDQHLENLHEEMQILKKEIKIITENIQLSKNNKIKRKSEEEDALKTVKPLEQEIIRLRKSLETFTCKNRETDLTPLEIEMKQPLWNARDQLDDLFTNLEILSEEAIQLEQVFKSKVGKPEDDSDTEDDESSESLLEAEEIRIARELEEQKQIEEELAYNKEWKHFQNTIKKDVILSELLEKVFRYLEYGTNCTIVTEKGLERNFIYLLKGRKEIGILYQSFEEGKVPQKKNPEKVYPIQYIEAIHMGQHSTNFQRHLLTIGGRIDPSRTDMAPSVDEINITNLHRYYYRSLGIQFKKDIGFLEFISDIETDFEGWITALYRTTSKHIVWGKKLFIDLAPDLEKLSPVERDFCEINHLLPTKYIKAKEVVLATNNRTFITLHDLRRLCSIDLYHSQKLQELWIKQRWVVRRNLNYFKYQEQVFNKGGSEEEESQEEETATTSEEDDDSTETDSSEYTSNSDESD